MPYSRMSAFERKRPLTGDWADAGPAIHALRSANARIANRGMGLFVTKWLPFTLFLELADAPIAGHHVQIASSGSRAGNRVVQHFVNTHRVGAHLVEVRDFEFPDVPV